MAGQQVIAEVWPRGRGRIEVLQAPGERPCYRCVAGGMALYVDDRWQAEERIGHLTAEVLPFRILYGRFVAGRWPEQYRC
jgi:hypothetical protein